jgi:hypothetical protein
VTEARLGSESNLKSQWSPARRGESRGAASAGPSSCLRLRPPPPVTARPATPRALSCTAAPRRSPGPGRLGVECHWQWGHPEPEWPPAAWGDSDPPALTDASDRTGKPDSEARPPATLAAPLALASRWLGPGGPRQLPHPATSMLPAAPGRPRAAENAEGGGQSGCPGWGPSPRVGGTGIARTWGAFKFICTEKGRGAVAGVTVHAAGAWAPTRSPWGGHASRGTGAADAGNSASQSSTSTAATDPRSESESDSPDADSGSLSEWRRAPPRTPP